MAAILVERVLEGYLEREHGKAVSTLLRRNLINLFRPHVIVRWLNWNFIIWQGFKDVGFVASKVDSYLTF